MKDKGETDKIMNGRDLKLLKCKVNEKVGINRQDYKETRLQDTFNWQIEDWREKRQTDKVIKEHDINKEKQINRHQTNWQTVTDRQTNRQTEKQQRDKQVDQEDLQTSKTCVQNVGWALTD